MTESTESPEPVVARSGAATAALLPRLLRLTPLALAVVLVAACANAPAPRQAADAEAAADSADADATTTDAEADAEPADTTHYRAFPTDTLYALLVAEFAARRGVFDVALGNYLEQAERTRDPGVAARATRLARFLNVDRAALDVAVLWAQVQPDSHEARFSAATELAKAGRGVEAMPHMLYLHDAKAQTSFTTIAAGSLESPESDRRAILAQLDRLGARKDADVQLSRAILLQSLGENDAALTAVRGVQKIEPDNYQGVLIEAQIYQNLGDRKKAFERIERAVAADPANRQLRLQYARSLAREEPAKAAEQFSILIEQNPRDGEMRLALALLYRETKQYEPMRAELNRLLQDDLYPSAAHFYLAQDCENEGKAEEAITHYLAVQPSSLFLAALTRAGELLYKYRGGEPLRAEFRTVRQRWPNQALPVVLLESEIRSGLGDPAGAEAVLTEALAATPEEPGLLYARSMLRAKRQDVPGLEQDLRAILRRDPENAMALNALGYSLADLTDRLDEAMALIRRAYAAKPDDPAIIDSMGWVHYRAGKPEQALGYLQDAYKRFPDPEVAAHLGEVLWALGRRDEARDIWNKAAAEHPDATVIPDTMKRLGADAAPPAR